MLDGKASEGVSGLLELADFSRMKFKDRDAVAEALRQLNLKVPTIKQVPVTPLTQDMGLTAPCQSLDLLLVQVVYDMQKAWESRCRMYYQERYDTIKNAVIPKWGLV